jgi:hypothetical protein
MQTYNTGKVQIGLLYEPKRPGPDEHDELVQRALLARGVRRVNWDFATPILSGLFFVIVLLAQAAGVFE